VLHTAALLLVMSLGPVAISSSRLRTRVTPVFFAPAPRPQHTLAHPVAGRSVAAAPISVRGGLTPLKLAAPPRPAARLMQPPPLAAPAQIRNTDAPPRLELPPAPAAFEDAAPAVVSKPVTAEIETARFDDPVLPVTAGRERKASVAVGQFGTDAAGERRAGPRGVVSNSGFGAVSMISGQAGHAGAAFAVAGFDAGPTPEARQAEHRAVRPAMFDGVATARAGGERQAVAVSSRRPVEVLYKPRPVYTQDALSRKIQGVVLLEVVFEASGTLRVLRVVRGLGFGLDESAIEAARRVRFKPALENSAPVDQRAILHIVFQLAG